MVKQHCIKGGILSKAVEITIKVNGRHNWFMLSIKKNSFCSMLGFTN